MDNNILQRINSYVNGNWGGKLLVNEDNDIKSKLKFMCKKGHIFERRLNSIKDGNFCTLCNVNTELSGVVDIVDSVSDLMNSFGSVLEPISNALIHFINLKK